MSKLDTQAKAAAVLANLNFNPAGVEPASVATFVILDSATNLPAAYIVSGALKNASGTTILDLTSAATGATTDFKVTGDEAGNASLTLWADQGDDAADKWSATALAASSTLQIGNVNTTAVFNFTAGTLSILGAEAGNAALVLDADESDDDADQWTVTALAASSTLQIGNAAVTSVFNFTSGQLAIVGIEAGGAKLALSADEADDTADTWTVESTTSNTLTFTNGVTLAATLTSAGALTLVGAFTPSGGVAAAGGFTASPRNVHTGGNPASLSTDGTNLSAVVTELYVAEVFIPANCTVTGAAVLWGDATEGNAKVALYDSAGTRVALSASTDISGYSVDSYGSNIAFSAPYSAKGPATYYLGVICDNSANRINTHILGAFGAGKITGLVYATEAGYATITPPTTFTTGLGPIASLY